MIVFIRVCDRRRVVLVIPVVSILSDASNMHTTLRPRAPWTTVAEARMALQYLERAENWAAEVDEEIVVALVQVHQRLLDKIVNLSRVDAQ
jgi:hypothetical protein